MNPAVLAAIGGLLLLLVIIVLVVRQSGDSDQDRLTDNQLSASREADPEERCSAQQTYDLIKRELFRRAAQVRGSDQAAFDRLSAYSSARMERPVLRSEDQDLGSISCEGALSLDLPPGVAVVGGRRTLSANIGYTLQPAADRNGDVVTLSNADAIITPLATLARVGQPTGAPLAPPPSAPQPAPGADGAPPVAPEPGPPPPPAQAPSPPRQPTPPPAIEPGPTAPAPTASARPSFNCGNARTRGEIAVCRDAGLASLDRQMASQFFTARRNANASQRALLDRTRGRFLAYRDRCRSDSCIADAYRGRIAEIRDIMDGRWNP
jgi:uncharacterized protein YecT (DUF1311 family)